MLYVLIIICVGNNWDNVFLIYVYMLVFFYIVIFIKFILVIWFIFFNDLMILLMDKLEFFVFKDSVIVVLFLIGIFWWIVNIDNWSWEIVLRIWVNILIILFIYKIKVNFFWFNIFLFIGNIVFLYL